VSDQEKKMSVEEARHLAYITGGSVRALADLEEIIRADQTRIVLERFKELANKWEKCGQSVESYKSRSIELMSIIQTIEKGQQ
jgi:hypothetical protein